MFSQWPTSWSRGGSDRPGLFWRRALAGVVLLLVLWVLFMPGRGVWSYLRLRHDLASLQRENAELVRRTSELAAEVERLRQDDAALEDVARSRHGLLRPNEIVYDFVPQGKGHKDRPPASPLEEGVVGGEGTGPGSSR